MVFVCNLRNIHSLANVVILFAIKTCQPCHYIKPIARVYTRECHENKNTRFWAAYVLTQNMSIFKVKFFSTELRSFRNSHKFKSTNYSHCYNQGGELMGFPTVRSRSVVYFIKL